MRGPRRIEKCGWLKISRRRVAFRSASLASENSDIESGLRARKHVGEGSDQRGVSETGNGGGR